MVQFAFWETVKLRRHDGTDVFDVVRYDYAVRRHADFYGATGDAQDLLCPFEKCIVANVVNEVKRDAKAYTSTCQTTFGDSTRGYISPNGNLEDAAGARVPSFDILLAAAVDLKSRPLMQSSAEIRASDELTFAHVKPSIGALIMFEGDISSRP
jgi:hypothetical protein